MHRFASVFALGTMLAWGWLGCEAVDAPAEPATDKQPMTAARAAEIGKPKPPQVAELSPAETEGLTAKDLRKKGTDAYKAGEFDRASAYYLAALQVDDRDHELHRLLGSVYARQGARKAAYEEYQRYVETCPKCMYAPTVNKILADYEKLAGIQGPKREPLPQRFTDAARNEQLRDPKEQFRFLVMRGDLDEARAMLGDALDPNGEGSLGGTWLHDLAFRGEPEAIALVIQAGGDPTATDRLGQTPAHKAARWGRRQAVDVFLANDVPLDVKDYSGRTLLHSAVAAHGADGLALVEHLLELGLQASARDVDGYTPLHLAGSADIARLLIDRGADVNAKARLEKQQREMLERQNKAFEEVEKRTGKRFGVDLGPFDRPLVTPLIMAARNGRLDVVRVLLEHGADVNAADHSGKTALAYASFHGKKELIELLLAHGAKPAVDGESTGDALHSAAMAGKVETIELLLAKGHDVDTRDKNGDTPLHRAAGWGQLEAVKALLAGEAKLDVPNNAGRTPLYSAAGLHFKDNTEVVGLLLARGADPNARDRYGNTPLWAAAQAGKADLARMLIEAGADVNNRNKKGRTPLHWAVFTKRAEYARALLDAGAEVDARDEQGRTPLALALEQDNQAVAEVLREHGAEE